MSPLQYAIAGGILALASARGAAAAETPTATGASLMAPAVPTDDLWSLSIGMHGNSNKLARSRDFGLDLSLSRETFPNLAARDGAGSYYALDARATVSGVRRVVDDAERDLAHTDGDGHVLAFPVGGIERTESSYTLIGPGVDVGGAFTKEFGDGGSLAQTRASFGGGLGFVMVRQPIFPDTDGDAPTAQPQHTAPWVPSITDDRLLFLVGGWSGGAVVAHDLIQGMVIRSYGLLVVLRGQAVNLGLSGELVFRGWTGADYSEFTANLQYQPMPQQPRHQPYTVTPFLRVSTTIAAVNPDLVPEDTDRVSAIIATSVGVAFGSVSPLAATSGSR